jgi:hypothetical protein
MGFKNFYLSESKTYKDSNQFVTLYHASPEGDIKRFRPKMKKILGDEVVFFSPSFNSLVLDWIPYVRGKKQGNGDELYKTIYLYTVKIPKTTYKKAKEYYNKKIKESGNGDNYGFWGWGDQIFLTKDMVDDIQIVNVKKLSEGEVKKLYHRTLRDDRQRLPDLTSYEYLKNLPKDEVNKLHIKIHETMLAWAKQNKDIDELQELNKELNKIRIDSSDLYTLKLIPSDKLDKKKIKEIEIKFEKILNPKTSNRDKEKEFKDWSEKIINKLEQSTSTAVQKIVLPNLTKLREYGDKKKFKEMLNKYKTWLGDL